VKRGIAFRRNLLYKKSEPMTTRKVKCWQLGRSWKLLDKGYGMERIKEPPIRINEVMELSGYSRSYIYKLVHWKKLPCHRPTNGRLFFLKSEILDFLVRNRQAPNYEVEERADAILNGEAQ
jgi:predicted DNA-binding transcriptional regulator AlpA